MISEANLMAYVFRRVYGKDIEKLCADEIGRIRESVRSWRRNYKHDICPTRYELEEMKKAYMVAYYPHYIVPAREVVSHLVLPALPDWKGRVHAAFFSGGPCPELYGTLLALKRLQRLWDFSFTILDEDRAWQPYQKITLDLCREQGLLSGIKERAGSVGGCDNLRSCRLCTGLEGSCARMYEETDLYFLQNYLSHLRDEDAFIASFEERVKKARAGALFVIIDLEYRGAISAMSRLMRTLAGKAEILGENVTARGARLVRSPYALPIEVSNLIFDGSDSLIERHNTNYRYLVLRKVG